MGGVPNRGGLLPNDSFNADESADSPGPGKDVFGSVRPGSGDCVAGDSSSCAGVGIWRTAGVPVCTEGMGEPSRAVESMRDPAGEICPEAREDDGTAFGMEGSA